MNNEKTIDLFEFYKELYHKENDRKQEVISVLNIPILIITTLITVMFYLVTTFDYSVELFLTTTFVLLIIFNLIVIKLVVYNIIRAYVNFGKAYDYSGIPYSQALYDWHKNEREKDLESFGNTLNADEYFYNYLVENLVKHINHNMYVNDSKLAYVYRAKKYLVGCLVITILILIPYCFNYFSKVEVETKVRIIGVDELSNKKGSVFLSNDSIFHLIEAHCKYSHLSNKECSDNIIIIDQSNKNQNSTSWVPKKRSCCESVLLKLDSIKNNNK